MRVGITTFGADGGKSGMSQYIIKLLQQLALIPNGPEFEVIVYDDEKSIFVPPGEKMAPICFGKRLHNPLINLAWHLVSLPRLCQKRSYDVLFLPAANRRLPFWVPCPSVGTVHDFSSTHVEDKYDKARMFFIKRYTPVLIRRLNMVLTVSENSKIDIMSFCGIPEEKVVVTPNGVDLEVYFPQDRNQALERVQAKYAIRSPYILYVSRIEHPGKNHVRLINAFSRLKAKTKIPHQLVLAGTPWGRAEEVYETAARSAYAEDISFIGFVDGLDLPSLYSAADIFVFPSLYEGFGMPILEAMACGVATVCSNLSSMPEVAGDAALLFDPYDEDDICRTMEQILENDELRVQFVQKGFERSLLYSWSSAAKKTLEVIYQVHEQNR
ncbi:MAG: glycosyltransferase family 1 protein [Desulfomonile sp.]